MKKKIFFIYLIMTLLAISLFYLFSNKMLRKVLNERKKEVYKNTYEKIELLLKNEMYALQQIAYDWGYWDDMYSYVKKRDENFEKATFQDEIFKGDFVEVFLIYDKNKKLILHKIYSPYKNAFLSYSSIKKDKKLNRAISMLLKDRVNSPFMVFSKNFGPLLLASSPILPSTGKGEKVGLIIIGEVIGEWFKESLKSAFLNEKIEVQFGPNPGSFTKKTEFLKNGKIKVNFIVNDLFKNSFMYGSVVLNEKYYNVIKDSFYKIFYVFTLLLLIFGLSLFFIIDKLLIKKVKQLSNETKKIKEIKDLNLTLKLKGNDEFSELANNINSMFKRLKEAEKKKREAEEALFFNEKLVALGRLVSNIAHEINNPTLAVKNSLILIEQSLKDSNNKDIREALEIALNETNRVRDIVANLLGFKREVKEKIKKETLYNIIDESIKLLKWSKKIVHTKIEIDFEPNCKELIFPRIFERAFINIIINAVEAMKDKGKIKISVELKNNFCLINIKDTGPGIPKEISSKIFEPFFTTKVSKGVGLGLYVSYTIIKELGGEITLDESYKNGASFIIKLPLRKENNG